MASLTNALQLEPDQALRTDHAQLAHASGAFFRLREQSPSFGPMGIQQIQPFVVAQVIGCILAAMNALVAQSQQECMQAFTIIGIGEEGHIGGRPHDVMRGERQTTNQGRLRLQTSERGDRFPYLVNEPVPGYMLRR